MTNAAEVEWFGVVTWEPSVKIAVGLEYSKLTSSEKI
jgi:hypothetical protein